MYKYKVFVYKENDINIYIAEKPFNAFETILEFLDTYIGCWCRFIELSSLDILIEGIFRP